MRCNAAWRESHVVLIAGGGTGGHLYPGIAVARELLARVPGCDGDVRRHRRRASRRASMPREGFDAGPDSQRRAEGQVAGSRWRAASALLPVSALDAWRVISRRRPSVVIGVGGYSSGPVVALAALRGIPTLLMEQNAMPGLTNRLLAPRGRRGGGDLRGEHRVLRRQGVRGGQSGAAGVLREQGAYEQHEFAARGGSGPSLWRLSGRARDQHGHGGGSAAAGSRRTTTGDHAPDRRARSGDGPRRVPAGRARSPGRAVPVRDGPGDEVGRPRRLPRRARRRWRS